MKLIHSGKVLKDTQTLAECQLKPNAFLVVMVSKVSQSHDCTYYAYVIDAESECSIERATHAGRLCVVW